MPAGSSSKRERQYEHIKDSARDRGEGEKRAKQIAARTVNKERARSGEAKSSGGSSGKASSRDASSSKRGGGSGGVTYDELYAEAKKRDIPGRSSMNKAELQRKLGR
ncbi:plasmid stabilization protein [Streptomyces sp. TRM76323]|uniref:Plasmid stabilization protein n=1 Tax=Streptomyces tamarix TaxID=3078565 RepID=A0ABU3QUY9_9ACTN|nr:plasmid stabilization protein [Streptomyces tamarix]MDT9686590.1 plasmid stabilization protein [Streptomyces tamarix]